MMVVAGWFIIGHPTELDDLGVLSHDCGHLEMVIASDSWDG